MSVVVVNWNRKSLLRNCLNSLRNQRDVSFEVIVVDNGSTDGSVEMIQSEFGVLDSPRIRLIRNRDNQGFCLANNQGFRASNTPFVALLNNDAEADEGWLAALLKIFHDNPRVGMAASKILVWEDPRRIDKVGHLMYPDGQNRGRGTGELNEGQYDRVEEVLWPDGCAAMYRRELIDETGGFDEEFFAYADDADLGLRARIAGWTCYYVPEAVVRHHRGATLGVTNPKRLELIERNRVLLAVKSFPWSLLWLNGAFYAARLAAGLWAGLRSKGELSRFPGIGGKAQVALAMLRGDLRALRYLPSMWRKRRELNRTRRLSPSEVRSLLLAHRIRLKQLMEQSN